MGRDRPLEHHGELLHIMASEAPPSPRRDPARRSFCSGEAAPRAQQAHHRGDHLSPAVPSVSREASVGSANKVYQVPASKPGCRSDMGCVLRLVIVAKPLGKAAPGKAFISVNRFISENPDKALSPPVLRCHITPPSTGGFSKGAELP